jgi:tRNA-dihydrouridine synthase A
MEQTVPIYSVRSQDINIPALLQTNYNTAPEMQTLARHRISIAPMVDVSNVHFRFFMRLLTKHSTIYTEMIHESSINGTKNDYRKLLRFNPIEHPIVIQIGGNSPQNLAKAAQLCQELGYDEVNINIGCPSERVQSGAFGACLMKEPEVVAECVEAMRKAVTIPVTIKTRLGVDEFDSYEFAHDFVKTTSEKGGVTHYIMHARKAYLKGLNPSENRTVPPLHYDRVLRMKTDFPHLDFSINGGFKTIETMSDILKPENKLIGCMIGRVCYENPWVLADVDRVFYNKKNLGHSRREILETYAEYAQREMDEGLESSHFTLIKPILTLLNGERGCNKYRQSLSDHQGYKKLNNIRDFIYTAMEVFEKQNPDALDARPPTEDPNIVLDTKGSEEIVASTI